MSAGVTACGGSGSSTVASGGGSNVINVGLVAPLTGASAAFGSQFKQGAELAIDQINQQGLVVGGKKYTLSVSVCDDQGSSADAVTCGKKLSQQNHDVMIFGNTSVDGLAIESFNQQDNFILMSASDTPSFTSSGNKLVVRTYSDNSLSTPAIVKQFRQYFETKGIPDTSVADLNTTDEVGTTWIASFNSDWTSGGGKVVAKASVDPTDTDFTSQLQSVLAAHPDVIAVTSLCQQAGLIVKQARQMGYKGSFVSATGCVGGTAMTSFAKGVTIGTYLGQGSIATFASLNPGIAAFQTAFQQKWNTAVNEPSAPLAYMGLKWFAQAVKEAGTTTDLQAIHTAYQPALTKLGNDNLLGATGFNPQTGDINVKAVVGVTAQDGTLTPFTG